jgi:hypothetical protein
MADYTGSKIVFDPDLGASGAIFGAKDAIGASIELSTPTTTGPGIREEPNMPKREP